MTRLRRWLCRRFGHPFDATTYLRSDKITLVDLDWIAPGDRIALRDLVYRCPRCGEEWTAMQPVTVAGETVYL